MNQLREVLKEVLQEELAPITGRLETRFDSLEDRFTGLESRFDSLEDQTSLIRVQLDRMEHTQTEDVVAILHAH